MTSPGSPASTIDSVLFDIDGTLVDSNDSHARAWIDAFNETGRDLAFTTIRPLIGMGSDKLLRKLDLDPDGETARTLAGRRKAIFLERYVGRLQATPGAHELLARLKARDMCCIVVSASSEEELDPLLKIAGADGLIDHIVRADDIEESKPDPDIMGAALAWRGIRPDRAVAIGDTPYDIDAAHQAGVCCIALRCGGSPERMLAAADAVFDSPSALIDALGQASLETILRLDVPPAGDRLVDVRR